MIHPKLTKKTLEGLLDAYDVEVAKDKTGFCIYSRSEWFSLSFLEDLISICNVFGYDFYVSNKADGTLYIDLF